MQDEELPKQSHESSGGSQGESAGSPKLKPFRVNPTNLHLPKEWTSGSVSELLEMLEGPDYR
jgi:hypothetical protein